ncbi:MAG: glycosyltransferase [Acidobacteria bacterium]|nr:glycosyltransferase [Acidobacteriota bacterium]
MLGDLASREPRLRVIHHPHDRGYGRALRSGFENATKDLIFYIDDDGQVDCDFCLMRREAIQSIMLTSTISSAIGRLRSTKIICLGTG